MQTCANLGSCQTATVPPGDLCFPHGCTGRASPGWWLAWWSAGPPCCSSKTLRDTFLEASPHTAGRSSLSSKVGEGTSSVRSYDWWLVNIVYHHEAKDCIWMYFRDTKCWNNVTFNILSTVFTWYHIALRVGLVYLRHHLILVNLFSRPFLSCWGRKSVGVHI